MVPKKSVVVRCMPRHELMLFLILLFQIALSQTSMPLDNTPTVRKKVYHGPVVLPDGSTVYVPSDVKIFDPIYEQLPEYPGGGKAMAAYISEKVTLTDKKVKGATTIQFIVGVDGRLEDFVVTQGARSSLLYGPFWENLKGSKDVAGADESGVKILEGEALKMVKALIKGPNWIPAWNKGIKVKSRVALAVMVDFSGASKEIAFEVIPQRVSGI